MIERTMLVRRHEDTLRIFHADVRAPGPENAEIPVALMERSQMTAVIIGPMQPHAIDALLGSLKHATSLPTWRCAHLLFQLPAQRQLDQRQGRGDRLAGTPSCPHRQRADDGASSVWNAMLNVWNEAKLQPGWDPAAVSPMLGTSDFPIKVGELDSNGTGAKTLGSVDSDAAATATPLAPCSTPRAAARRSPACSSSTACSAVPSSRRPADSSSPTRRAIRNRSTWSSPPPRALRCSLRIAARRSPWGSAIRSTK
jgi:hypothetical protein